jgi:hypothetical protein
MFHLSKLFGSPISRTAARRADLGVVPLEVREVPAGVVHATLAANLLILTGDDADNQLIIRLDPNQVTLTPDATTRINGAAAGAPVTLTGRTFAVSAFMAGGNDNVRIDPSASGSCRAPDGLPATPSHPVFR